MIRNSLNEYVICVQYNFVHLLLQAVKGQGIDRHLLGLKLTALTNNMKVPNLHMDIAYSVGTHFNISTSQVCNHP